MPSLTQTTGLKLAPLFLQTLVRHYYGKVVKDANSSRVPLRDEELLYDEVFYITKQLMQDATMHTVEEFQSFTKARSLSPPWENVIRTLVPLSSCDAAAAYLINVFGGEEAMRCVAGGTKWWQVRNIQGVEAEWVTTKKTFCEASRDRKKGPAEEKRTQDHITSYDPSEEDEESIAGCLEMDEPCLLYIHGGGYYFGSADGGKSSMERYARMTRGRVFAVDYRLAPQYPFPCAIQDVLAAYLYLIQPPVGAPHCPVNPNKIVICGDSSGGGLALALLQVIRDAGLPLPAGGVLVSPWCDLTHSFRSITTNTDTDVLPATGLSLHKPSLLWPPPPEDITSRVHARLRMFANDVIHDQGCGELAPSSSQTTMREQHGTPTSPQFQFYAENRFLRHPLVSPALAYLGGLPPLFFIAGNGEVLRDEIVYTAHRAAQPEKFPVSEDVKELYPPSGNVKDGTRTPVHLQVYDDAAHILPILFPFSTPAKFCVRAIARFVQRVTDMKKAPPVISLVTPATTTSSSPTLVPLRGSAKLGWWSDSSLSEPTSPKRFNAQEQSLAKQKRRKTTSLSHAAVKLGSRTAHIFQFGSEEVSVGGTIPSNLLNDERLGVKIGNEHVYAGDHMVYNEWAESKDDRTMIRERVSTQGIIRPLEPENELPALALPSDVIGIIQESVLRRYLAAKEQADQKFASIIRGVEKQRARNIDRACKDLALRTSTLRRSSTGYHAAPSSRWRLAWAVDPSERPPPSSISGRLDMEEALGFARELDRGLLRTAESTSNQRGMTGLWRGGATRMMAVLLAAK